MRIISFNANGIRASARKGFFDWLKTVDADVVCIQETKAQTHQLEEDRETFFPAGFTCQYHDAVKKGYSGVGIYCKTEPKSITAGFGWEPFDHEGRWIEADFGDLVVVSMYFPSGTSGDERQNFKYKCMDKLMPRLDELKASGKEYIICGDWNIAHHNRDIKNWKGNLKNSGFLPEERAWLTQLFDHHGWVDVFRELNQEEEQFTWWSQRGQARANNVGWRIDYHISTPGIAAKATSEFIYTDEKLSDHAPLVIDYDHKL